ncbi:MAG: endospore germination permease [Firmicutes bacterium]|nr:endospore germination permease [Bacillota bacterium]
MTIEKISRMQYFFMIPNLLFGKAIGVTSGVMVRRLGADNWLAMAIGFGIGILIMLLMVFLCSRFPDKTIVEFSEEILGKWIGKLVGLVLGIFFIFAFGASANTMTLHLSQYFMPETPYILICLLYTLLCMYGVFLGPEVVARFSLVGFIMLFMITLTMTVGTIGSLKPINLFPLMNRGILENVVGSTYIFGDIAFVVLSAGFIYPLLDNKARVGAISFWAMIIGALSILVWPVFEIMVLGPDLMKQYVVVCMQQIRCAQLTKYFPRQELIMVSFFTFSLFVQSAVLFFCSKHSFRQAAGIMKEWVIILPLTVVLVIVTYYMGVDNNRYIDILAFPYSQVCASISLGLPAVLLLTALFRGKLKKPQPKGGGPEGGKKT